MLPGAEYALRQYAQEELARFRAAGAAGEIVLHTPTSRDSSPRPNYDQGDPFYSGPRPLPQLPQFAEQPNVVYGEGVQS